MDKIVSRNSARPMSVSNEIYQILTMTIPMAPIWIHPFAESNGLSRGLSLPHSSGYFTSCL